VRRVERRARQGGSKVDSELQISNSGGEVYLSHVVVWVCGPDNQSCRVSSETPVNLKSPSLCRLLLSSTCIEPVPILSHTLRFIQLRKSTRYTPRITTSLASIPHHTPSRLRFSTYSACCSLSFAFCHDFHRCSSLKLASRQDSFPGSSAFGERRWSFSSHEREDFCFVDSAATVVEDVLVLGCLSEDVSVVDDISGLLWDVCKIGVGVQPTQITRLSAARPSSQGGATNDSLMKNALNIGAYRFH
jgi:hypothetical protein